MTKTEQGLVAKYEELYAMIPAKISGVKAGEQVIFGGRLEKAYNRIATIFDLVQKLVRITGMQVDVPSTEINPDVLLNKVAEVFETPPQDIRKRGRKGSIAKVRAVFCTLLVINSEYSFNEVAEYLNLGLGAEKSFDHSTIIHYKGLYREMIEEKSTNTEKIIRIIDELQLSNYNAVRLIPNNYPKKLKAA